MNYFHNGVRTVGELRKMLAGIPDDVLLSCEMEPAQISIYSTGISTLDYERVDINVSPAARP